VTNTPPGTLGQSSTSARSTQHMVDIRQRGGAWREEVWDRVGRYRDAINRSFASSPGTRELIDDHLREAESVANDSYWPWAGRRRSRIEAVWRELRLAEEAIVAHAEDGDLLVLARDAISHGKRYLGPTDSRVVALQEATSADHVDLTKVREETLLVLTEAHKASDASHRVLGAVGQQIALWTGWLAGLAGLTVIGIAVLGWEFLPAVSDGADGVIEGWQTVLLAMVAGLVGAVFTAVPSISLIPDKGEPFNPVWRQAALKMVIGAWSGFIGVLAVTTGLAEPLITEAIARDPATPSLMSLSGFVMTAALFGASQEAISRFADRRASIARESAA